LIDFISSSHFTLTLTLPPKAALKRPALQTLRAAVERQELAPAFGVRASLAPLFIRRSFKAGFRGSMREVCFGGILSLKEREQRSGRDDLRVELRSFLRRSKSPTPADNSPSPSGKGQGEGEVVTPDAASQKFRPSRRAEWPIQEADKNWSAV
jgi:hypothetical protein